MNATLSRRARIGLPVVVATLLVSGIGAAYLRQGATTVSVDAAVEAFRASVTTTTTSPGGPAREGGPGVTAAVATDADVPAARTPVAAPADKSASAAPFAAPAPKPNEVRPGGQAATAHRTAIEEGVYAYATEGYEETNALGGARHDYPAETAVTVRRAECGGWTQRWQPLAERWDESDLCPEQGGNAFSVRRFTTYHEFFQQHQQQDFTCPEGSHVSRFDAPPGTTWQWRCTAGASAIETNVVVVGTEQVDVGGTVVNAVHMHYSSKMSGGNTGTQEQHRWLHPESGLNVKITTDIDTQADSPFGRVHYVEHYTITLLSLTPRR